MPALEMVPQPGTLTAHVFENEHIDLPPTLFFCVEIPVEPFELDGELQQTSARLDFIRFGVRGWRDLAGREFEFPRNPGEGYIDGSLYLGDVHNPAEVTRIRFGHFRDSNITATFDIAIDFTFEGPEKLGVVGATWEVELSFDPAVLDSAVQEAHRRGAL